MSTEQSKATIITQTDNFLHVDYDTSKLVLFDGEYGEGDFTNNTGSTASFGIGTVIARNSATGNLVPYNSAVTGNGVDEYCRVVIHYYH